MTLRRPSPFFRLMILGAQGVFYNLFCESDYINLLAMHSPHFDSFRLPHFSSNMSSFRGSS